MFQCFSSSDLLSSKYCCFQSQSQWYLLYESFSDSDVKWLSALHLVHASIIVLFTLAIILCACLPHWALSFLKIWSLGGCLILNMGTKSVNQWMDYFGAWLHNKQYPSIPSLLSTCFLYGLKWNLGNLHRSNDGTLPFYIYLFWTHNVGGNRKEK